MISRCSSFSIHLSTKIIRQAQPNKSFVRFYRFLNETLPCENMFALHLPLFKCLYKSLRTPLLLVSIKRKRTFLIYIFKSHALPPPSPTTENETRETLVSFVENKLWKIKIPYTNHASPGFTWANLFILVAVERRR